MWQSETWCHLTKTFFSSWKCFAARRCRRIDLSHDMTKPTKWVCARRRLRSAWASAQSSLSAWRKLGSLAAHWAHSEDSDQTGWMARLIWVLAGHTLILLVLSCRGSYPFCYQLFMPSPQFYDSWLRSCQLMSLQTDADACLKVFFGLQKLWIMDENERLFLDK